ncbi:BMP family ABC transporter substrate-binding protein [candidate division KSB3 bacterium]|uniref:BMP family ABC transporter substrate-binding protein n=1 Tax=candidate division KSB3 bacterium TaxID=2044937 RepID=A0A2G6E8N7_9BACT|nr:MAG: BMP family ABC transporter substrate-binding protein [candidate division KSB3 bacterium]PIE30494.1 MAG: BMP family ABC transporter substrate-binding protein [candidate division KSB3 bacterium]
MRKLMLFCLIAGLTVSLIGTAASEEKTMKAAFVYISAVGDHGWSYAHDLARKYMEDSLGVETAYTENVFGPDIERVIRGYAQKGYDIIFTTSFEYMDPTIEVAADFPNIVFEHCSGFKTAENAGNYFGRIYQARYLSGLVAGKMTKSNIIGYVAAHPIPEVIRGINSFTKGVRETNPEAVVKVVWTGSWYDPAKEKEAALSLISADADVIAQHQDSPAAQEAAQDNNIYSIGYNTDMSHFAPDAHLTAPIWNWKTYYERIVDEVKSGTWTAESYWGGLGDGLVDISDFGPMVPQDVIDMVMDRRQEIIDGTFSVWPDTSDEELLSMNYFIEGVEGKIPE